MANNCVKGLGRDIGSGLEIGDGTQTHVSEWAVEDGGGMCWEAGRKQENRWGKQEKEDGMEGNSSEERLSGKTKGRRSLCWRD